MNGSLYSSPVASSNCRVRWIHSILMTLALATIGTVLGVLNFLWNVWTWKGSNSRVQVSASLRIFPGLTRDQMLASLGQTQLPPEQAKAAQQLIQFHAQVPIPTDLSFPASAELVAALPPEAVMVVATITNTGRLPVTIQRCSWRTSQPDQLIEAPNAQPGVSFPHRLGENDQCISVISLTTIMSVLDAPLRDGRISEREAWPLVEVANLRKSVRGKSVIIPTRSQPTPQRPTPS
jgi:hypothetical protein